MTIDFSLTDSINLSNIRTFPITQQSNIHIAPPYSSWTYNGHGILCMILQITEFRSLTYPCQDPGTCDKSNNSTSTRDEAAFNCMSKSWHKWSDMENNWSIKLQDMLLQYWDYIFQISTNLPNIFSPCTNLNDKISSTKAITTQNVRTATKLTQTGLDQPANWNGGWN